MKLYRLNRYPKEILFRMCRAVQSVQSKEMPFWFEVNLHSMNER